MTVVTEVAIMTSFSKSSLTPWQPTTLRAAIRNSCDVYTYRVNRIVCKICSITRMRPIQNNLTKKCKYIYAKLAEQWEFIQISTKLAESLPIHKLLVNKWKFYALLDLRRELENLKGRENIFQQITILAERTRTLPILIYARLRDKQISANKFKMCRPVRIYPNICKICRV